MTNVRQSMESGTRLRNVCHGYLPAHVNVEDSQALGYCSEVSGEATAFSPQAMPATGGGVNV
jgi:hypothetical protein